MTLQLEAGVDRALQMLKRYDQETETWDIERASGFWDSVALAHASGRRGDGYTIAVVDGGFDPSYSAIRRQTTAWNGDSGANLAHGTVVALLVLAVAPDCSLVLYPASVGGSLNEELVARAIIDATQRNVDLINLSLGEAFPTDAMFDSKAFFDPSAYWPEMTTADLPYWSAQRLGRSEFRDWLRITQTLVSQPAVDAATSGCIVVAAAGNYLHTLSVPAVCPEVLGAAFEREKRTVTDTIEIAESGAPTYTPSDFTDFAIIQPENVLGSSFATPLLVGFATLMNQPTDLDPFRDMVRNGGLASELLAASSANAAPWTDRQRDVVIELYEQAMAVRPHVNDSGPCPECALFAVPTYIDYGLLRLNLGDLDAAERLTMQARIVAPGNAFAAANLGVIYGAQADRATRGGELSAATGLLDAAITHMGAAVSIRPDYPPYARRLGEFTTARLDPQNWTMRR